MKSHSILPELTQFERFLHRIVVFQICMYEMKTVEMNLIKNLALSTAAAAQISSELTWVNSGVFH